MGPEDREFMREMLLRHEKATDAMIRRLDEGTAEMRQRTAQIRQETAEGIREMRDDHAAFIRRVDEGTREFVAEMRAQRQALFRILDRLDSGGASAGA
jgi:uncharacterized protein (DUF305 family)